MRFKPATAVDVDLQWQRLRWPLSGAVIVENIFAYPGMGRLGYEAVLERDYPTLVALNFVVAALVLLGNLISDILSAAVDPRVRLE